MRFALGMVVVVGMLAGIPKSFASVWYTCGSWDQHDREALYFDHRQSPEAARKSVLKACHENAPNRADCVIIRCVKRIQPDTVSDLAPEIQARLRREARQARTGSSGCHVKADGDRVCAIPTPPSAGLAGIEAAHRTELELDVHRAAGALERLSNRHR